MKKSNSGTCNAVKAFERAVSDVEPERAFVGVFVLVSPDLSTFVVDLLCKRPEEVTILRKHCQCLKKNLILADYYGSIWLSIEHILLGSLFDSDLELDIWIVQTLPPAILFKCFTAMHNKPSACRCSRLHTVTNRAHNVKH